MNTNGQYTVYSEYPIVAHLLSDASNVLLYVYSFIQNFKKLKHYQ